MYEDHWIYIPFAAFLLGSLPFGLLLAKLFRLPDPRSIGSGNIGATNMLRTGRKDVALLTLLLDGGKGAVAVLVTLYCLEAPPALGAMALLFATAGHMFSPWLSFKGGKGVATTLGGMLALSPLIGGLLCAVWLAVFAASRISSLSALTAFALLPVLAWFNFAPQTVFLLTVIAGLIIFKHRANIGRLMRGEEPKFGSAA